MAELQQLMEEVKMLKDSVQQETEEKNKLLATITDKDVCLERALADTDHLKAQLAEKEEQVGWGLSTLLSISGMALIFVLISPLNFLYVTILHYQTVIMASKVTPNIKKRQRKCDTNSSFQGIRQRFIAFVKTRRLCLLKSVCA